MGRHRDSRATVSLGDAVSMGDRAGENTKWAMILLAVLALAAGLRVYGLGEPDFWLDELHSQANSAGRRVEFETPKPDVVFPFSCGSTGLTAQSTWLTVWRGMSFDSHPPVYFVLLNWWRRAVGDGEGTVRLLPVFFSILSLIPVALILRECGRPGAGLAVACLLAVTFGHIRYAQENRPYSLAILWVCMSYWVYVKMLVGWEGWPRRDRWGWGTLYVFVTLLAVMTHYFTVLALIGQAVVTLTGTRGSFRRAWVVLVLLSVAAFGWLWGAQMRGQWAFIAHQPWLQAPEPDHLLRTILRLTAMPVRLLEWHGLYKPGYLSSVFGVILLAGMLAAWRGRTNLPAKLFALWYLVPVLFFAVVDATTGRQLLQHLRYSCLVTPALVGLMTLAMWRLRGRRSVVALAVVGAALLLTLHLPTPYNPRARRAAGYIVEQWRPGDLLVFEAVDGLDWARQSYQTVRHYLSPLTRVVPDILILEHPADDALKTAMADHPRMILVSPRANTEVNPLPGVFRHVDKTGYVRGVGEIHLLVRIKPNQGRYRPASNSDS